jgi:alkylation response protein AidB-like acyl-CoA dehydrogenase
VIPEQYGGLGFKSTAYSRTLQEIAKHDASVAVTIGAHAARSECAACCSTVREQRQKYYPKPRAAR